MRQHLFRWLALSAVATLWSTTALARPPFGDSPMGRPPMFDGMANEGIGMMLPLLLRRADLTADQHAQIDKIMETNHQTLQTLFKQLEAAHNDLADRLFAPGNLQATDLAPQTQRIVQLRQQLMDQGLKTAIAIRAVLTPEQLTKMAQLKDRLQKLRAEMHSLLEGTE